MEELVIFIQYEAFYLLTLAQKNYLVYNFTEIKTSNNSINVIYSLLWSSVSSHIVSKTKLNPVVQSGAGENVQSLERAALARKVITYNYPVVLTPTTIHHELLITRPRAISGGAVARVQKPGANQL
jgi:hypothetical protein